MHPIKTYQRHIPDAEGHVGSVDNGIFIHAIVPRHVETVCLLYHQKDKFISVPYEPKDAEYLKMIPGSATYDEIKDYVLKKYSDSEVVD